jgi:hypothetical protein
MRIPNKVVTALLHVREHCPEVDRVVYWGDARWQFMDSNQQTPAFPPGIDFSILEDSRHDLPLGQLPVAYQLAPTHEAVG